MDKNKTDNIYNHFHKTRVVTRNFISDWLQGIRSLFGLRMKSYEIVVETSIKEIIEEISSNGNIDWHRMNIDDIKDGFRITIYGCYK